MTSPKHRGIWNPHGCVHHQSQTVIDTRPCEGFTLVEVLIASFILATGVLAFLALQLQALNVTRLAGLETQAAILASDVADSARANLEGLISGAYNRNKGKTTDLISSSEPNCTTTCTPSEIAALDINRWLQRVADEIKDSEVSVQFKRPLLEVFIEWPARESQSKDPNNQQNREQYVFTTQICTEETPRTGGTKCLH